MKYLFIGGSRDGQRIEVKDGCSEYRAAKPLPTDFRTLDAAEITTSAYDIEHYNKVRLCDFDGAEYAVFRYADDNLSTIARLIDGYRKHEPEHAS